MISCAFLASLKLSLQRSLKFSWVGTENIQFSRSALSAQKENLQLSLSKVRSPREASNSCETSLWYTRQAMWWHYWHWRCLSKFIKIIKISKVMPQRKTPLYTILHRWPPGIAPKKCHHCRYIALLSRCVMLRRHAVVPLRCFLRGRFVRNICSIQVRQVGIIIPRTS